MYRLVRLFTALFIAYWGQSLLRAAEPTVSVALRDGSLVLLIGLLLFAGAAPAGLWRGVRNGKSFIGEVDGSHIAFGLVLLFALMRLFIWNRWGLGSCLESGCAAGLRAQELLRTDDFAILLMDPAPLFTLLTALFFGLFGADLESLRLLGLLLGILTVPALYLATVRLVGRATATVASLLLVFATWHMDISFGADPNVLLILLLLLYLWAWAKATQQNDSRWDIVAGLLGGLALLSTDLLPGILLLLWFILTAAQSRQSWLSIWPLAGVLMLPRLLLSSTSLALLGSNGASEPGMRWEEAGLFLRMLLTQADVWPPVTGLLALLGLVYLLRYSRLWAEGRALLIGVLLILWLTLVAPAHLPLLLGLLLPVAVIGLAPFVAMFADVWRPVLRPVTSYAAASILLVALLGFGSVRAADSQPAAPGQTTARSVIGRYLHEQFQISVDNGGEESTLIIVPAAVLNHPTTRLAAGGVLPFARHIIALDPVNHLPWADAPFNPQLDAGVEYVVPLAYLDLFALLRQLYSGAVVEPLLDEENAIVGWRFPLSREQIVALQGLPFAYFEGEQPADPNPEDIRSQAVFNRNEGPLLFHWQTDPPMQAPFHLSGQGLLYAPESGIYGFQMEIGPGAHSAVAIGLEAEQQILLDSANGVTSNIIRLRQGVMPIAVTYTSGPDSTDFGLLWQRPAGKLEPVPRQALYTFPLESGLLASYYSAEGETTLNSLERQPLLAERREPLLHAGNLPRDAVGVIWQGKLAAPVQGQYAFDLGSGQCSRFGRDCPAPLASALLRVNGIDVVRTGRAVEGTSGAIPLSQGWHDFELRFLAAEEEAPINLVWQAPGTAVAPIPPQYFLPLLPSADTSSLAIPTELASLLPPDVVDISAPEMAAGQENFTDPSSAELPTGLPELPLELEWQLGVCGSGADAFSAPKGISIVPEADTVYIADVGNRRVVVRSLTDGALLEEITSEEFEEPFDLDVNVLGEVFLLDAIAQRIWRLDPSGLLPIDVTDTTFYRPRGMGVDIGGQLFVADTGGNRVVVLADGRVVQQFGGPDTQLEQPSDVLALPNGAIWAISPDEGQLWRLDTGQGQMATARANTFDAPHFAGLLDSSFFLTDPEQRKVLYFRADGTAAGQFQAEQFAKPTGLATAMQGERLLLAVSDTLACSVSVWSMPAASLP